MHFDGTRRAERRISVAAMGENQASNKHVLAVEDRVPGGRRVLGQAAGPGRKQTEEGPGLKFQPSHSAALRLGRGTPSPKAWPLHKGGL